MTTVLSICFIGLALVIGLGFVRLIKGPTVTDRMLAFELMAMSAVGVMVLFSVFRNTGLHLEVILVFALLGFLSTVVFVFYLNKSNARSEAAHTDADAPAELTVNQDQPS